MRVGDVLKLKNDEFITVCCMFVVGMLTAS